MSKIELAGLDGLIERLRDTDSGHPECDQRIRQAAAKLEALRDCARELAGFVEHKGLCAWHVTCTCGLDEALARFREVGEG